MDISDYKQWLVKYIVNDFKYFHQPVKTSVIDSRLLDCQYRWVLPVKKPQDIKISLWGDIEKEENKKDSVTISENEIVSLICEDE